jgi:hypothetical protein
LPRTCKARTGDSPSISPVNVSLKRISINAGLGHRAWLQNFGR